MPSNPGKPGCPNGSVTGWPEVSSTDAAPFGLAALLVMAGFTYFAPKRALNPVYPPASSGSWSGLALAVLALQMPPPAAQWMAMPTKSVCGWARTAGSADPCAAWASFHSGEPTPNTLVMSPVGSVPVFSRTVLAIPAAPTSHPALVNVTHGAGVIRAAPVPPSEGGSLFTMFGFGSADGVDASVWSVQYLKLVEKPTDLSGLKKP